MSGVALCDGATPFYIAVIGITLTTGVECGILIKDFYVFQRNFSGKDRKFWGKIVQIFREL